MSFVTTTKTSMDTYFAIDNDLRHHEYVSFSDGLRIAAFNQAVRELESILGGELSDPTDLTDYTGQRLDYACYEQALWLLEKTKIQKGDEYQVIDYAKDEEFDVVQRKELIISPKASRYLRINFIRMVRG